LSEALAADHEGVGMVGQTIQGSTGKQIIGKYLTPLFKGAVGGDDQRTVFIAFGDDLVEILGSLGRNGLQSEVVQDEQIIGQDTSQMPWVGAVGPGELQVIQQALVRTRKLRFRASMAIALAR
jgi:hypothetical protein